ncbi:glyoxylate carboligase [Thorsellia kenyensis]|uniref:Glyoxylate carboligase n=1 Tax=Thorsellia kenyensis TaxID=1549888 RepID=A0ABV6C7K8_9GAMM
MAKMRAIDAAVLVMKKEGIETVFGVPGAAINPLYSAMQKEGGIEHILARHVEGASHMADGYARTALDRIGVCIGTSGPAGTDMITGLYAAVADSIPILCITGQAPIAKLHKEDFQAVDIEAIAKPIAKWAVTVKEPGLVPRVFQQAFHVMRSGRRGPVLIDLPIDVQLAEIEFDIDSYEPLPIYRPSASEKQLAKVMQMIAEAKKPVIIAGGGIINAEASKELIEFAELTNIPVIPTLMGWGSIPDSHPLMAGMVGIQTSHKYGNTNFLDSDLVIGIGNRWANRHTGSLSVYTKDRKFIHIDIEPTQIGRVFNPDLGIASDAKAALSGLVKLAKNASVPELRKEWANTCLSRKLDITLQRKTHFDDSPIKPQRVYEEMNRAFGEDACYVTTIGLSQIAGAQFLNVYKPRRWINAAQAGPLGWTLPAALGVAKGYDGLVVGLSGDYDFQFLIEELAVGAQFNIPYLHVLVNNSYLGLIRQAQRAFDIDYCVQLAFDNINNTELNGYGVDHKAVVEGLGCKAIRVTDPNQIHDALIEAKELMEKFRVPVVVEIILERVTNIAMGAEIDNINEFEALSVSLDDAPMSIAALQNAK